MTTEYTLIETSELAKVRDVLDRFIPEYLARPVREALNTAKPVEVVGQRFISTTDDRVKLIPTGYVTDASATWNVSPIYAIKEKQ